MRAQRIITSGVERITERRQRGKKEEREGEIATNTQRRAERVRARKTQEENDSHHGNEENSE